MEKSIIDKFIGIRFSELHCFDLCIKFLKEHSFDLPFSLDTVDGNLLHMARFMSNFDVIYDVRQGDNSDCSDLKYGDLLYVNYGYWGICIDENTILTSNEYSGLFDLRSIKEENRLLSIFRPKAKIETLFTPGKSVEIQYLHS